jgi:hypothetical protein
MQFPQLDRQLAHVVRHGGEVPLSETVFFQAALGENRR